jgi:hypothetical protein
MARRMNQKERNRYGDPPYNAVSMTEYCVTYKACKKKMCMCQEEYSVKTTVCLLYSSHLVGAKTTFKYLESVKSDMESDL